MDDTSSSNDLYQTTKVVGHNFLNNGPADIQLKRRRFWSYTHNFTCQSSLALCLHCQQAYNPVHYVLNSPAHPMYRRRLKGHLLPEDCKLPDHHLSELIIRKSTFRPDIINPPIQTPSTTITTQQKTTPGGLASRRETGIFTPN